VKQISALHKCDLRIINVANALLTGYLLRLKLAVTRSLLYRQHLKNTGGL